MFEATSFTAFAMGMTAMIGALFAGLSHSRCTSVKCSLLRGCEVQREVLNAETTVESVDPPVPPRSASVDRRPASVPGT